MAKTFDRLGLYHDSKDNDYNVKEADKLEEPRKITLSGSIAGEISFDGSSDVNLVTNILDPVELTTNKNIPNGYAGLDEDGKINSSFIEFSSASETIDGITSNKAISPESLAIALHYTHIQGTPATVWVVNHNLNRFPNVTIIDSASTEVEGDVEYIDINTIKLSFSAAFSGKAYLN